MTVYEKQQQRLQFEKRKREKLSQIGDNRCGVYKLKFPNGKEFVGWSRDIKKALNNHYGLLFPTSKTLARRQRSERTSWHDICIEENKGMSIDDIELEVIACGAM